MKSEHLNFIKIVSVCDRLPHLALEVDLTLVTLEAGVSLLELFSSALAASCCWLRAAAAGEDSLGLRLARTAAGGSLMVNCWRGTGLSLGVSRPRLVSRALGLVLCSALSVPQPVFTITEKAPSRAFSWLKAPTSAFTFKTLLRHYAKWALTPR